MIGLGNGTFVWQAARRRAEALSEQPIRLS
jgi:hypothetical protein